MKNHILCRWIVVIFLGLLLGATLIIISCESVGKKDQADVVIMERTVLPPIPARKPIEVPRIKRGTMATYSDFILQTNKKMSVFDAGILASLILDGARTYDDNPDRIIAMMATESGFDKEAKSYLGVKYGRGLLQVSEVALKDYNAYHVEAERVTKLELYDPETNIRVAYWALNQGMLYLSRLEPKLRLEKGSDLYYLHAEAVFNKGVGKHTDDGMQLDYRYVTKCKAFYQQVQDLYYAKEDE